MQRLQNRHNILEYPVSVLSIFSVIQTSYEFLLNAEKNYI